MAEPERPLRFASAFRAAGWVISAGGVVYLYLGIRGMRDGGTVAAPLVILGLVAIVVGTALIRWGKRKLTP